ncbi:MAG: TauD/TfdA dioxygenase family protein [Ilumatobacteraceae bacterium]
MSTSATTHVDVRPLTRCIGAEISGVDISRTLDDATVAEIRHALLEWKVVFFRDQTAGPAEQLRFAERFGNVAPGHPTLPGLPDFPSVLPLLNREAVDERGEAVIESEWHTDVTFTAAPPMGSILRAVQVPPCGGDTHWTNLVVAYERLSEPLRRMLDGLHAVHRNVLHVDRQREGLPSKIRSVFAGRPLAAVHPVVRVLPETGERALFVNPTFTSHIIELARAESDALLSMLYDHIGRPEFSVRFQWAAGSIAFWDNRSTAHLAPRDLSHTVDESGRPVIVEREMHRVTLEGDVPVGPDGVPSRALDGSAFV